MWSEERRILWMGACLRCSGCFWVVFGDLGALCMETLSREGCAMEGPCDCTGEDTQSLRPRLPPAPCRHGVELQRPVSAFGRMGEPDCVLRPESKRLRCSQACTDRTVQRACQSPGATYPCGWTWLCACVPGRERAWAEWGVCLWGPPHPLPRGTGA